MDPILFKNLYNIAKEQNNNKKYSKWENYQIKIKDDVFKKTKNFNPIND